MKGTHTKLSKFLLEQEIPEPVPSNGGNDGSGKAGASSSKTGTKSNSGAGNDTNANGAQAGKGQPASGIAISPAAAEAAGVLARSKRVISAVDQVTQVALESCHCIHLQEYLPHILNLNLVKTKKGWDLENPIHALHVTSQLDGRRSDDYSASEPQITFTRHKLSNPLQHPPVLYGEEQQRTMAMTTDGIVDYWSPLDGQANLDIPPMTPEEKEELDAPTPPTATSMSTPAKSKSDSGGNQSTPPSRALATPISKKKGGAPPPVSPKETKSVGTENQSKSKDSIPHPVASSAQLPPKVEETKDDANDVTKSEDGKQDKDTSTDSTKQRDEADSSSVKHDASAKPEAVASTQPDAASPTPVQSNVKQEAPTTPPRKKGESKPALADKATSTQTPQPKKLDQQPPDTVESQLSEQRFTQLRLEEDRIRTLRRTLANKRFKKKPVKKKKEKTTDKKGDSSSLIADSLFKPSGLPGWDASKVQKRTHEEQEELDSIAKKAKSKVEFWMDTFRLCRETNFDERELLRNGHHQQETGEKRRFFQLDETPTKVMRCCQVCSTKTKGDKYWKRRKKQKCADELLNSNDLMQCLECSFIGCMPSSVSPNSRQHILQHLLLTGHNFAMTCGERIQIFCFKCGDFVFHPVFSQEADRIACAETLPLMAWKDHTVQRSFDAFQFLRTLDHGVVWRGLIASYPPTVPQEHIQATEVSMKRHALFEGFVQAKWLIQRPTALAFASSQAIRDVEDRYRIRAPVGMYNLGNTCFQSAILQCLVHCIPLQRYYLQSIGHDFIACNIYRHKHTAEMLKRAPDTKNGNKQQPLSVCVACELDRLFLQYYGSTVGRDVISSVVDATGPPSDDVAGGGTSGETITRGEPLITSDMLTAAWKSRGMDHLAGYEQRDAHEFLNSFLDLLGKHTALHRDRIFSAINTGAPDNAIVPASDRTSNDIIKELFEGTLRSVLLCEECGGKRMLVEPFMNISLTLSDEVERRAPMTSSAAIAGAGAGLGVTPGMVSNSPTTRRSSAALHPLSVQTCLEHFILPEVLSDPVQCPSCKKKTSTKKQHTFSKLPKILCLHLKRFDAAKNRKIDEYVSFPAKGLNMGSFLSHWSELSRIPASQTAAVKTEGGRIANPGAVPSNAAEAETSSTSTTSPKCYYDLFGTVNHVGSMESGHYISNVNVDGTWYHCNDSHVSVTTQEAISQQQNEGAYLLFYAARRK